MKMVKSLLLGSAAGLVAMAGAQAADLPVKAKPVQYVKICSLYGAGFYYIPGTDTCLKVGGAVRAEMDFNANGSLVLASGDHSARTYNFTYWRARALLTMDARSQTEYGTLRTYLQLGQDYNNGGGPDAGWAARAFIQWAGFTFGVTDSFFDFWPNAAFTNSANRLNASVGGTGVDVWAYTAQFGNGLSATISAEDGAKRRGNIFGAGSAYGGRQWPDLVGNLRIDQAWGSAQIMGAVHQVRGATYGDKVGYAAGAAVKVNLPWAKGDMFVVEGDYSKGVTSFANSGLSNFTVSDNGTDTAYAPTYDAVGTGTDLELTTAWSVIAGVKHNWNPMWDTTLWGGYGAYDYGSAATAILNGGGTGNPDWKYWQVGSRTSWKPVKGLTFSAELMYQGVDSASAYSGATVTGSDVSWLSGMIRVQRNF